MTRIAVTFALPAESSEFLRRLGNKSRANRNGIRIVHGTIGHRSIEVIHTGVGENICRQRIGRFLENQQFDFLISAGFAGSLNHELQVNDLLVAKNFSTVDLKHASLSNVSIYAANMLTVSALIDSGEERERIAHESGAAAVDMETEFIARACATHGIPLLALRVHGDQRQPPSTERRGAASFAQIFQAECHSGVRIACRETHDVSSCTKLYAVARSRWLRAPS